MNVKRTILAMTLAVATLMALAAGTASAWTNSAIAGHRGATGVAGYPEETTRALAYADSKGATYAEGDVLFTADNEPMMLHDRTLDRTTDCTGRIDQKTFAQVRECAPSSVVPSVLTWVDHAESLGLKVILEVRSNPLPNTTQLDKLEAQIRLNMPRELVLSSFDPAVIELLRDRFGDDALYAPIVHARTADGVESLFGYSVSQHAANYDILITDYSWLIVDRVHWYHEAGMPVFCYTANSQTEYDRMRALNCDAMIVDDAAAANGSAAAQKARILKVAARSCFLQ